MASQPSIEKQQAPALLDSNSLSQHDSGLEKVAMPQTGERETKTIDSEHTGQDAETSNDEIEPDTLDRWNTPRINTYRYCVVNLSLLIMGMNDACLGVSWASLPFV